MSIQLINQVLSLTNNERKKAGLKSLKLNNKLASAADLHSDSMAEDDFFSHTGIDGSSVGDRVKNVGYQYQTVGENIAAGYSTASAVVTGWMNSSGHRANILNADYAEIGIGYEFLKQDTGSVNYNHYWTQVFGTSQTSTKDVDPLTGSNADDRIIGTANDDVIAGKGGNDLLRGGNGADTLLGGAGNDRLIAGAGNDVLNGGAGSDILIGGTGADKFVLYSSGVDKIRNFELGADRIGLANNMSFDNLEIRGSRNSVLFYEGEKIAVLIGTNPNDLNTSNFSDI